MRLIHLFPFLLSTLFTMRTQETDFDPDNPYCTEFADSTCQSCGSSDSNTYALYDSICTAIDPGDEVFDGEIIRRCHPSCSDCFEGYCRSCSSILNKMLYKDDEDSEFRSCVAECKYGSFGDDESGACQSCPANCSVCKDRSTCLQCDYSLTRWPEEMDLNENSILNCDSHSERLNIASTDENYTKKFYIIPTDRDCSSLETCDGSLENPYDDMRLVLKDLIEELKIGNYFKLKIEIYLLKDNTNTYHFWLEDEPLPTYYYRLFEGTMIDALIQPAVCEDLTTCFTDDEKATIYLKSNMITLFVAWKLTLKKIIFDASELIPDGNCYNLNKYTKNRCCSSLENVPTRTNSETDAICNPVSSLGSLLVLPDLEYDPSIDIWPTGPYSFITLQPIPDASEFEIPELMIESCEFKHFWYHRYAHSLISLSPYGSKITIKDTLVTNFYFRNGLITNAYDSAQRETLFTPDVVPKFDCPGISTESCFSIWIEGSTFNYSLFDNTTFMRQGSQQNLSIQNNEGIVMFLTSFDGPITLLNNTFEKIASVQVSIAQPLVCGNGIANRIGTFLNHSLDRKVQLELGSEYLQNVRSSSLINIRNLVKGIVIYNNTFKNNIALTGTNFLIHNFDNTKIYPIIIEKNVFEANFALVFGSSFALVNYERDYVTMDCEGVYIHDNLFTENTGCPNASGNAMVICIPEKPSLSPFLQRNPEANYSVNTDLWVTYYPSVNQKVSTGSFGVRGEYTDDIDSLTQDSFAKFLEFITQNKDETEMIVHPITQELIDVSRVKISSNTFLRNQVSNAQLFVQGARDVQLTSNILEENTFVFPFLFDIIPAFRRTLANSTYNLTTVSSPITVRLANFINMEHNEFVNNTQHDDLTADGITIGSAISIDRHLGGAPVVVYNNTFRNYSGVILLEPLTRSTTSLNKTSIPPLVTYSIWQKLTGLECDNSQYSILDDPDNAVMQLLDCKIESNVQYNQNLTSLGRYLSPNSKGIIWYFDGQDKIASNGVSLANVGSGCHVTSKASLYIENSTFISNVNEIETALFNFISFDYSYIHGNQFTNNTLYNINTGIEGSLISYSQGSSEKESVLEVSGNLFEGNSGRLLYINQSLAANNIATLFRDNIINNHTTRTDVIQLVSATNCELYNLSGGNLTVGTSLIHAQGSSATVEIQNINIYGIRTFGKGCLYVERIDDGFTLSDFTCSNSELYVDQSITLQSEKIFVACFAFYNQNSTNIEFDNIACDRPSISYNIIAPISQDITFISCFTLNKMTSVSFNNLSCIGASIQNTTFVHPLSYLGKVSGTPMLTLTDSTFEGNKAEKSILIQECMLNIFNVTAANNSAIAEATFMQIQSSHLLYFEDFKFQDNICLSCLGGIIMYRSDGEIQNSVFSGNQATEAPVFNLQFSDFSIENSNFSHNTALDLSSAISIDLSYIWIYYCRFEENNANRNLITALESSIDIFYSTFIRNQAKVGSRNIYTVSTYVFVYQCTFLGADDDDRNGIEGAFLAIHDGYADVYRNVFQKGVARTGGAIFYNTIRDMLNLETSTFIENSAYTGGAVYATGKADGILWVKSSTFTNNYADQGGAIYTETISTDITGCNFDTNGSTILYLSSGTHEITNNKFNAIRQYSYAQAIYANRVIQLESYFCEFYGFGSDNISDPSVDKDAPLSPVVLITESTNISDITFGFCTFSSNQGVKGGVIYAANNVSVTLENCEFYNNKAIQGGAVYFTSNNPLASFDITGTGDAIFLANEALQSGGALQYTNLPINVDYNRVKFKDNVAGIYGPDKAAYGIKIVPLLYNAYNVGGTSRVLEGTSDNNITTLVINDTNYASGQILIPSIVFELRDEFDTRVATDNSSTIELAISYVSQGITTTPTLKGNSPFSAMNGYFNLSSLRIFGVPGSTVKLKVSLSGSSSEPTVSIIMQLRECSLGESLTDDLTCKLCQNGKYTLTTGEIDSCKTCPQSGYCLGGSIFGPKKNFWRYSSTDHKLNECFNEEACLGAIVEDLPVRNTSYCPPGMLMNGSFCFTGWCREGYSGTMCSECDKGWAQSSAYLKTCSRCSDSLKYIGIMILLLLAGGLYVLFVITNVLNEEKREMKLETLSAADASNKSSPDKPTVVTFQNVDEKSKSILLTNPQDNGQRQFATISSNECGLTARDSRLSIYLENTPLTTRTTKRPSINLPVNLLSSNQSNTPLTRSPTKSPSILELSRIDPLSLSKNNRSSSPLTRSPTKRPSLELPNEPLSSSRGNRSPSPNGRRSRPLRRRNFFNFPSEIIRARSQEQLNQTLTNANEMQTKKTSIYIKILTNYIQLISIIGVFDFAWPDAAKKLFVFQTAVSKTASEIFSFDCVLKQSLFAKFGLRSFFTKLIIVSVSPIVIIVFIILIWIVIYLIKYRAKSFNRKMAHQLKSNIIVSIIVTLFIIHPSIVELSIQAFQCSTLGDDASTSTYLTNDLELECYSREHLAIALPIALPSLIIWGFGIPFVAWFIIFKQRNMLHSSSNRARYGFLYLGYKKKFYYWEFVISYRKLVLIVLFTFLSDYSNDLQALIVLGISACFYLLQVKITPYETPTLNEMEKRSLIVSTVTIYCGLFYLTGQLTSNEKFLPFITLILVNLYFLIYWMIEFLKAKSEQMLANKYCEKYCGKVLRKLAAFEWKRVTTVTGGGVQQIIAAVSASLRKKKTKSVSIVLQDIKENNLDQCKQSQINDEKQRELVENMNQLEEPSDITLGESDYNVKKIRKSNSFQNLFLRTHPVQNNRESISNVISSSMCQPPKSHILE